MIDPRDFRATLARFATGITIVTTRAGGEVHGITVNAFMSVSLDPPLVLVSIDRAANANRLLRESGRYGVSILSQGQDAYSTHFAGRVRPDLEVRFTDVGGVPLIAGALAHLVCRIVQTVEAGDHTLFIGEVEHLAHRDGRPLVYFGGRYAHLDELHVLG
jgi:flavin reductase (DIM6/NTAB) family NADH-FMN oxidoreductase RutF